jgi:colicin import membrane protein
VVRGRKRKPGSTKALVLAVLVHVALLVVLLVSFRWSATREPQPVVQATVVQEQATVRPRSEESRRREQEDARKQATEDARRKAEEEKTRSAEAKRQRDEEARKQAEVKKRQEEEQRQKQLAEQKRKAQEQEKEKTRQAEEAKRRKAEEEKARAAEVKRRQEEDTRRRQAEQSLKEQLAAEESEREAAAKAARAQTAIEKYKALIRQRVTRNWSRPMGSAKGLTCVVQVKLVPGGEVVQARVVRSSGDPVFDRSVENAVFKSTPLPLPQDKDLFEYFREIEFLFSPEG